MAYVNDTGAQPNRERALAFIAAMASGDSQWFEVNLAPDFTWINPMDPETSPLAGNHDRAGFIALSRGMQQRMPGGLRIEVRGSTAEGDRVAVEAESFGASVAGPYHNRYHFLFVFRDGQVVVAKEYADSAYMAAFVARMRALEAG